jgi:CDP-glucose 4,6-dehydratase
MIKNFNLYKCFSTRTILVTGHTGFKGSWLSLVLSLFGAKVIGVSLKDNYKNSMINIFGSSKIIHKQYFFNICDNKRLQRVISRHKPSFVFHLAAQAVVKVSFDDPIKTWNTNLIGTINILNNLRLLKKIVAVIVTSDKCYKNIETYKGYKE